MKNPFQLLAKAAEKLAGVHILLPTKTPRVLQAQDKAPRGLIVTNVGSGRYDIQYWYDKPDDVRKVEIKVDGRVVSADTGTVTISYHAPVKGKKP